MTYFRQSTLQILTTVSLVGILTWAAADPVFAGGGSIQPINFADSQQIMSKSFSPVVAIKDPGTNYAGFLVGKEYSIQAHGDLAGANCNTTQRVSDSQGQIKADCHADAYGSFSFDIVEAGGGNNGTFRVIFTEPGQGSGSGFNEQTPAGDYTVSVSPTSKNVMPNQVFYLSSQLKKDGQNTNDDEVDYYRWEVLQGSLVIVTSDHLNKNPGIKVPDLGKTVIRCTAVMKNGKTYESGAVSVTVAWPPTPSPIASPVLTNTNTNTNSNSNTNTNNTSANTETVTATNVPKTTPSVTPKASPKGSYKPSPSASASASPVATESASPSPEVAVEAPAPEKFNIIVKVQSFAKMVSSFFTHLWKR